VRACSVVACALLILAAAILAFLLCTWLTSWIHRTLVWADSATSWLLQNATEKICRLLSS